MTSLRHNTARRWVRSIGAAAGACALSSVVPLVLAATASADPVSAAIDAAAADPIGPAIEAATAPITAAQSAIDAVPTAGLSAADLAILTGQTSVLDAQEAILGQIDTYQGTLTLVDPADLASLDTALLVPADNAVLDATTAFLAAIDDPVTSQLSSAFDLVGADFGALGADLNVIGVSATAELLNLFGISDTFLFAGF